MVYQSINVWVPLSNVEGGRQLQGSNSWCLMWHSVKQPNDLPNDLPNVSDCRLQVSRSLVQAAQMQPAMQAAQAIHPMQPMQPMQPMPPWINPQNSVWHLGWFLKTSNFQTMFFTKDHQGLWKSKEISAPRHCFCYCSRCYPALNPMRGNLMATVLWQKATTFQYISIHFDTFSWFCTQPWRKEESDKVVLSISSRIN